MAVPLRNTSRSGGICTIRSIPPNHNRFHQATRHRDGLPAWISPGSTGHLPYMCVAVHPSRQCLPKGDLRLRRLQIKSCLSRSKQTSWEPLPTRRYSQTLSAFRERSRHRYPPGLTRASPLRWAGRHALIVMARSSVSCLLSGVLSPKSLSTIFQKSLSLADLPGRSFDLLGHYGDQPRRRHIHCRFVIDSWYHSAGGK